MAYRNHSFLRAVAALPRCVGCGRWGCNQAAHANMPLFGKGGALKASDAAVMALCWTKCHPWLDQGRASRHERHATTFRWITQTYIELIEREVLTLADDMQIEGLRMLREATGDEAAATTFVAMMERGMFRVADNRVVHA